MAGSFTKTQVISNNNGAVAAATVAGTLAASQPKSTLLAFVFCAAAGVTITPPAGWTQIKNTINTQPAGGAAAAFIYQANPGGITVVSFGLSPSALAVVVIYELASDYLYDTPSSVDIPITALFANTNATSWGIGNRVLTEVNECCIAAVGFINNTQLTTTYPTNFVEDTSNITTAAAGNACIRSGSLINPGASSTNVGGLTLSGTPANGPDTLFIALLNTPVTKNNGNVGPANLEVSVYT